MTDAFVGHDPVVQSLLAQLGLGNTPVYSWELDLEWRGAPLGQVRLTCTIVTASEGCDMRDPYRRFVRSLDSACGAYCTQALDAPVLRCQRLISRENALAIAATLDCHEMRELHRITVSCAQGELATLQTRHNACRDQLTRLLPLLATCDAQLVPVEVPLKERGL